jgi:hypothetical protein
MGLICTFWNVFERAKALLKIALLFARNAEALHL